MTGKIAALYVDLKRGPYGSLPDVEAWDEKRDARRYPGPFPVVAHPPCSGWGTHATSGRASTSSNDCGSAAWDALMLWGGVIEQPYRSTLFRDVAGLDLYGYATAWKLGRTPWGQWLPVGNPTGGRGLWVTRIKQGDWGFESPKATLLVCNIEQWSTPPSFEQPARKAPNLLENMPSNRRHTTPRALALALVELARMAYL